MHQKLEGYIMKGDIYIFYYTIQPQMLMLVKSKEHTRRTAIQNFV